MFAESTVILLRAEHSLNAPLPMLVTLDGISIEVSLLQNSKQKPEIVKIPVPSETEASSEHTSKALLPMLVTLDGISIEVSFEQYEKAFPPMLVTLDGIVIEVRLEQP